MARKEAVVHWQRGAQDSPGAAEVLSANGMHSLALLHGHLAVEKALKATIVLRRDSAAPPTHNLLLLAGKAALPLDDTSLERLATLTRFVIDAPYDDPG